MFYIQGQYEIFLKLFIYVVLSYNTIHWLFKKKEKIIYYYIFRKTYKNILCPIGRDVHRQFKITLRTYLLSLTNQLTVYKIYVRNSH